VWCGWATVGVEVHAAIATQTNDHRGAIRGAVQGEKGHPTTALCKAFALWRQCPVRRCRREQTCRSDHPFCMALAYRQLPHRAQWQARQDILDAMPANIGAPERPVRQCMPYDFFYDKHHGRCCRPIPAVCHWRGEGEKRTMSVCLNSATPTAPDRSPIHADRNAQLRRHVECVAENGGGVDTPVLRLALYYRRIIASTAIAKTFRHGVYKSLRLSDSPEALNGDSRLRQRSTGLLQARRRTSSRCTSRALLLTVRTQKYCPPATRACHRPSATECAAIPIREKA
jgi:hypothetical protein